MTAILLLHLMLLSLLTSSVLAAGDDIQVLSSTREIRFPTGVHFNLEVEGEADILEVRLYYRVRPSGPWTYAYPYVAPSRHVETSFNLNTSGISYLPPGAEVEYYYSIRDSQGNVLETSPETFVYVDNRFQWQTVDAGPLTIYWHDLSEKRVKEMAPQVQESLYEIGELLNVRLDKPIRGIIYNSRAEAMDSFPQQSRTITEQQVFQGFAFPERGVFVGVGLYPSLIIHESAHLLLDGAVTSPLAKVPAWLNEGFASYVEPDAHGYSPNFPGGTSPDYMPLRHMYTVPGKPGDIRYFYTKSESVVGYLLETHGREKFRDFLGRLNEGKESDTALAASYGFGLDELDQRWASALGRHAGSDAGSGSAPFAHLNTLIIALLPLVIIAALGVSLVVRKFKSRTQAAERVDSLTEDEWVGRP